MNDFGRTTQLIHSKVIFSFTMEDKTSKLLLLEKEYGLKAEHEFNDQNGQLEKSECCLFSRNQVFLVG